MLFVGDIVAFEPDVILAENCSKRVYYSVIFGVIGP